MADVAYGTSSGAGAKQYNQNMQFPEYFSDRAKGTRYRSSKSREGGNQVANAIQDFFTDRGRDILNFWGDWAPGTGNVWNNRPMELSGGAGDALLGSNPRDWETAPNAAASEADKLAAALAARDAYWKEQMDSLKKGDPYDSIISTLTGRKATDSAKLKALYDAASTYVTGQAPAVEDIYNKAKAGYESGTQAGTNLINANYAGARSQLENMLKSLGIEYTAGNIMDRGQDLSGGQTAATDKLASFLTSNLARNTASQTSALENLQNMAQAIQAEGARSQSTNLRSLEDQINKARLSQQQYQDELQRAAIAAQSKAGAQPSESDLNTLYAGFYNTAKQQMKMDDKAAQAYAEQQVKNYYK